MGDSVEQPFSIPTLASSRGGGGVFWLTLFIASSLFGVSAGWFFHLNWVPALENGVSKLPEQGGISGGWLSWPEPGAVLCETPFLGIRAEPSPKHTKLGSDLQIYFEPDHFRIGSFLGETALPYPRAWEISFNRDELEPLWGAWRPFVPLLLGGLSGLGLLLAWMLLAVLLLPWSWLLARLFNRDCCGMEYWRMGVMAFCAPLILLIGAVVLYGLGRITLLSLLILAGMHALLGVICLTGAIISLPKRESLPENPFSTDSESPAESKSDNPFRP